jgi:hypothetical protein
MRAFAGWGACLVLGSLALGLQSRLAGAQRDGQRDFDFHVGSWKTRLSRLAQPLSGSQETFNGRAILVRFIITILSADSARFEQSFSDDGGKTWEANWLATDTRVKDESTPSNDRRER